MTANPNKNAPNSAFLKASRYVFKHSNQSCNKCYEQSDEKRIRDRKTLILPTFADYEEQKHCWDERNPNASATERDAAILQIVKACGV